MSIVAKMKSPYREKTIQLLEESGFVEYKEYPHVHYVKIKDSNTRSWDIGLSFNFCPPLIIADYSIIFDTWKTYISIFDCQELDEDDVVNYTLFKYIIRDMDIIVKYAKSCKEHSLGLYYYGHGEGKFADSMTDD